MRVLAICGSLQAKSSNLSLLQAAADSAPPGVEVVLFNGLRDLPHFDPDLEERGAPAAVLRWRAALTKSEALLIASPEYGHSLPGVLKNGIDWTIGSGELERKIVAVTASVPHPMRGRLGLKALCETLAALSAKLVGGEPIARGEKFADSVRELMAALKAEVERPRDW